jgi:hypothetical protein
MGRLNWNKPSAAEETDASQVPEDWEVPAVAPPEADPWLGPGHLGPTDGGSFRPGHPFRCRTCLAFLRIEGAFALDGEVYCFACRPTGAVSSGELPRDHFQRADRTREADFAAGFVRWAWRSAGSVLGILFRWRR